MWANQSMAVEGTPFIVKNGVDDKNTTTTYIQPDGSPRAIVMRMETDATYSRDSETKGKGKADNLDGTFSANELR